MRNSISRCVVSSVGGIAALVCAGCVVYTQPAYRPVVYEPAPAPAAAVVVDGPAVEGPVIEAPGVLAIDVEPDPAYRVYVYDPGYPPGCYFYGGYYWYGGYRYPHDVFINRYVTVNVRENRFVNVDENRRQGHVLEQRQRTEYVRTAGHRPAPGAAHEDHHEDEHRPY